MDTSNGVGPPESPSDSSDPSSPAWDLVLSVPFVSDEDAPLQPLLDDDVPTDNPKPPNGEGGEGVQK